MNEITEFGSYFLLEKYAQGIVDYNEAFLLMFMSLSFFVVVRNIRKQRDCKRHFQ